MGINLFALAGGCPHGNMNEVVIPVPYEDICFSRHCCMDSISPQKIAKNMVIGIRRQASDDIAGIDEFKGYRDIFGCKIRRNSIFQEQADVL